MKIASSTLLFILVSVISFAQETIVSATLTGQANKKETNIISLDNKGHFMDEKLEFELKTSSEIPTQVSFIKTQPNGKIIGSASFWVFDDTYQVTGSIEDFSTLKIFPNHPYNELVEKFANSEVEKRKELIADNISTAVGLEFLSSSVSYYSDEELAELLAQVPESLQAIVPYTKTKTNLLTKDAEKLKIGMQAPDFELESRKGKLVSLSDFDGKYRLLDFSNSGCGPCFMALPEIKEAYEKYGSEVEVISIWDDKTKDIWMNFSKKHKEQIIWTDLWDAEGYVSRLYQIKILPSYILVNPNGEIEKIWNSYREGKIVREMDSIFGKN
ncbi:redoxin domain-containing protein [Algoriphagus sp.]|uniref:TlpA family protein disulfide reductase n=1 Tax=Algoriphagus sp. TaxID=1872435 RepID=UPI003270F905